VPVLLLLLVYISFVVFRVNPSCSAVSSFSSSYIYMGVKPFRRLMLLYIYIYIVSGSSVLFFVGVCVCVAC